MKPTIRIVTRGSNGELRSKDYEKHETVLKMHTQIGVDDCSTDLGTARHARVPRPDRPDARRQRRRPLRNAGSVRDADEGMVRRDSLSPPPLTIDAELSHTL